MSNVLCLTTDLPRPYYSYEEIAQLMPQEQQMLLARDEKLGETTRQLYYWLATQSSYYLDAVGVVTMLFLISRTYGYFKQAELVSRSQLLSGVWSHQSGESIAAPPLANQNSLKRVMGVLTGLGFITKTRVQVNGSDVVSMIRVNADVILASKKVKVVSMGLKISKKHQQEAEEMVPKGDENAAFLGSGTPLRMRRSPLLRMRSTKEETIKKEEIHSPSQARDENPSGNALDCKSVVEGVVSRVARSASARLDSKAAAAATSGSLPRMDALNAAWKKAMLTTYARGTVPVFTHKEYGMLKRVSKAHTLDCTWVQFISWVVEHWASINEEHKQAKAHVRANKGAWSLTHEKTLHLGTEAPDPYQFIMCFGRLIKHYAQRSLVRRQAAPAEGVMEVESLKQQLAERTRQAAIAQAQLQQVLRVRSTPTTHAPKTKREAKIVDPEKDDFFSQDDGGLPDWK